MLLKGNVYHLDLESSAIPWVFTEKSTLPVPVWLFGCENDGVNFIYTFGGFSGADEAQASPVDTIQKYDITANTWSQLSSPVLSQAGPARTARAKLDMVWILVMGTSPKVDLFEMGTETLTPVDPDLNLPSGNKH